MGVASLQACPKSAAREIAMSRVRDIEMDNVKLHWSSGNGHAKGATLSGSIQNQARGAARAQNGSKRAVHGIGQAACLTIGPHYEEPDAI